MTTWRIPKRDDPFLIANAARMYELLVGVEQHVAGMPLSEATRARIQQFFVDAYAAGIDTIAVSEGGFRE